MKQRVAKHGPAAADAVAWPQRAPPEGPLQGSQSPTGLLEILLVGHLPIKACVQLLGPAFRLRMQS